MSEIIYSDIWGELLTNENGFKRIQIYEGGRYNPKLILDSSLAVENFINYLKKMLKEMKQ